MKTFLTSCLFVLFMSNLIHGQTSIITGIVYDKDGESIENVIITCKDKKVVSDLNGTYSVEIPSAKAIKITFNHPSFQTYTRRVRMRNRKFTNFSPKLTNNLARLL